MSPSVLLHLLPLGPRRETHSLGGEGGGEPIPTHLRKPCQNGDSFLAVLAMEESFHSVDHLVAVALRLAEITGLKSKGVS